MKLKLLSSKNRRVRALFLLAAIPLTLAPGLRAENNPGAGVDPFRPQFHFTPETNWMNDPNGLVYYEGEYHLFYQCNPFANHSDHLSWGHAVSRDLVHWQRLPVAIPEGDGVMIFSGSAVVDWKNTSGFGSHGKPPLVAIYAGFRPRDGIQFQCIAFSNDRGRTWTKYSGNPVIDIGSRDFRDPKVQWHEPTRRWIMTVALSADHKIRFYGSSDLKEWSLLSEFGPAGATGGSWECPDLFELPVAGTREKRWVLTVNTGDGGVAGGSGGQYFIGQFDGVHFTEDPGSTAKSVPEYVPDGELVADFEGLDYGAWKATGDAFGTGPAHGKLPNQNPVEGFRGQGLVNSYCRGDVSTGTLASPPFKITRPFLNFLIGGGAGNDTRMDLIVDGKIVRTASGADDERLQWRSWNVREHENQTAVLRIVDNATGRWGHINVDQIMLAPAPVRPAPVPGLWFEQGKDCYATVSWSDIPKTDGRRIWLGWMINLQYGGDIPTSPWRGAMTIPRKVGLRETGGTVRLVQSPVREMKKLRDKHFEFKGGTVKEVNAWLAHHSIRSEPLELDLELDRVGFGAEGASLFKSENEQTLVGLDRESGRVFLDRTKSGLTSFSPRFPGIQSAPLASHDGHVKLHVFVDACSVEVFVNDGEIVLTDLVFPSLQSCNLELFGHPHAAIRSLNIWTLKSIWK